MKQPKSWLTRNSEVLSDVISQWFVGKGLALPQLKLLGKAYTYEKLQI